MRHNAFMPTQNSDSTQENGEQTAAKRVARSPKIEIALLDRAAITPNEFAGLFGRQTVWGYRQIYAGKVKVIKDFGRIMIPRQEVQRLIGNVEIYNPNPAAAAVA